MLRVLEDVLRCAALDDLASTHHVHVVRDHPDDREIVADEYVTERPTALQINEKFENLFLHQHIQRRDRLVQDDEFGIERQCTGDRDALPLSAGELMWVSVDVRAIKRDLLQQSHHSSIALGEGADAMYIQWLTDRIPDAVPRVERGVRVLEHRLDLPPEPK